MDTLPYENYYNKNSELKLSWLDLLLRTNSQHTMIVQNKSYTLELHYY